MFKYANNLEIADWAFNAFLASFHPSLLPSLIV